MNELPENSENLQVQQPTSSLCEKAASTAFYLVMFALVQIRQLHRDITK